MKLGILGTGKIVQETLPMLCRLGFEKMYLLSTLRSRERAEKLREEYRLDGVFYDYDELLQTDADTVYVALPNALHYAFTKKALLSGKHVILEKPAVPTEAELRELDELARQKGCLLFEALNIHYLPAFGSLKESVRQIGQPKIAVFNFSQYSSRYDAFKRGQILPVFDPAQAGGALMDLNVYNIHAAVSLFGQPREISYHANVERGIDTSGVLVMDYGAFKVVAIGAKDCAAPMVTTIQADRGCLRINAPVSQMEGYEFSGVDGTSRQFEFEPEYRLYHEFVFFRDAIEQRAFAQAEEAMKTSMIVCRIMEEARKQAGIRFDV